MFRKKRGSEGEGQREIESEREGREREVVMVVVVVIVKFAYISMLKGRLAKNTKLNPKRQKGKEEDQLSLP